MMTENEINTYVELDKKFKEECERVTEILMDADIYSETGRTDNPCYADEYSVMDKWIQWHSSDRTQSGCFPVDYLRMTEDELKNVVQRMDDDYKRAKEEREARHKLYLELKREFGD